MRKSLYYVYLPQVHTRFESHYTVAGTHPNGLTISGLRSLTVCAPTSAIAVQISFFMTGHSKD